MCAYRMCIIFFWFVIITRKVLLKTVAAKRHFSNPSKFSSVTYCGKGCTARSIQLTSEGLWRKEMEANESIFFESMATREQKDVMACAAKFCKCTGQCEMSGSPSWWHSHLLRGLQIFQNVSWIISIWYLRYWQNVEFRNCENALGCHAHTYTNYTELFSWQTVLPVKSVTL